MYGTARIPLPAWRGGRPRPPAARQRGSRRGADEGVRPSSTKTLFADFTWVATGGGLAAIARDGTSTALRVQDGLNSNSIYTLTYDSCGRLWAVTVGGLECFSRPGEEPPEMP